MEQSVPGGRRGTKNLQKSVPWNSSFHPFLAYQTWDGTLRPVPSRPAYQTRPFSLSLSFSRFSLSLVVLFRQLFLTLGSHSLLLGTTDCHSPGEPATSPGSLLPPIAPENPTAREQKLRRDLPLLRSDKAEFSLSPCCRETWW